MIRIRHKTLSVALLAGCAVTACSRRHASASDSTDLANDLALASQQQAATPQFNDTALAASTSQTAPVAQRPSPRPQPVRAPSNAERTMQQRTTTRREPPPVSSPAPVPTAVAQTPAPAPAPAAGQIGAGTGISMYTGAGVCTSTARPGDRLVATVDSPVRGTRGATIPAGATVVLEVASVDNGNNGSGGNVTFRVSAISINGTSYPVQGDVTSLGALQRTKMANSDPNADKKKVIGGAVAGAILGQIFGHSTKSTVIGAAAGGAAGAIAAKATQKYDACLPAGSSLRLTLNSPIVM